jgi:hypothetical protein
VLEADIDPQGKLTRYHFEYGKADCASSPCVSAPTPEAQLPAGTSPVSVKVPIENLDPGAVYHFRVVAKNGEQAKGPDRVFATYSSLLEGLPDNRAYEQSSPTDKGGGDVLGTLAIVKAASNGDRITFNSSFGVPGGKGAQVLPTYLATRGTAGANWSTQGLLPPALSGERAQILGWLPDFSRTFSNATKLGNPRTKAFLEQSSTGEAPTLISPYVAKAEYSYVGASEDASVVLFEAQAKLPPSKGAEPIAAALEGRPNLYAWDRGSREITLAGVMNDGKAPPQGAFAGPYDWRAGTTPSSLREGGGARSYYLQEQRAISSSGDVFFTEAGTGQLFQRRNPTEAQSAMSGEECTEEAKACTVHISASQKTNGDGANGADPAGIQPAIFHAASADGSEAIFTSSEKLTNEANTGPEQPAPAIGLGGIAGGVENDKFIPEHAVGIAVDGSFVYWTDPAAGTIGRAEIDGDQTSIDRTFIVPTEGQCKAKVEVGPGEFTIESVDVPNTPRYVAVDSEFVYWTNTGRVDKNGEPLEGGGTVGRARLNGEDAEPTFICGEEETSPGKLQEQVSDPQGIAVNASHIYWSNAPRGDLNKRSIARAAIGAGDVEPFFFEVKGTVLPSGVALDSSYVYFGTNQPGDDFSYINRVPLVGGTREFQFVGRAGLRGVAVDSSYAYWATQGEAAIGRIDLNSTLAAATVDPEFIKEIKGTLNGLAADSSHLYWSVNGEAPTNPGNDLYRFQSDGEVLEDLTPTATGDGAEVRGVLGASADGSHVYFAANGDLDGAGPAGTGDCEGPVNSTTGSCSIYLRKAGTTSFVARVRGGGGSVGTDALDWAPTPRELFGTSSYSAKTSFLSADGQTLLFRSREKLTSFDNEGTPELYLYRATEPEAIRCVSCPPSGEAAEGGPSLGSIRFFSGIGPPVSLSAFASRNLSADGNRAFFETTEALTPADTNGLAGCPPSQGTNACLDVYEWEAPGSGSCTEGGASFSLLNGGCVYLISTGKSEFPSVLADASASGDDVFFFTHDQLVGQDGDALQDVYDARVGGGLASQNPHLPPPCGGVEACSGPGQTPPAEEPSGSAGFVGPSNPVVKHKKQKTRKHKAKRKQKKQKKHKKTDAKGGNSR